MFLTHLTPWFNRTARTLACLGVAGVFHGALLTAQPTPVPTAASILPPTDAYRKTAAEMDSAMQVDNAAVQSGPLFFQKGHGLRILMTGHSWVAPARITLPEIAQAGGYADHVQRAHTNGGANGSPHAIWLNEHGKDPRKPNRTILLPAIATGQWDVMTWGMYTGDTPQDYIQWIDLCLKSNPTMVFYMQDGWPTPRFQAKGASAEKNAASFVTMYDQSVVPLFKANYEALAQKYPGKVHIIPAGPAVVEMIKYYYEGKLPGFDCLAETGNGKKGIYSPDSFHLSRTSGIGFLLGYCYYGELYRRSPESIANYHPQGVNPEVDRLMRIAAWQAIIHSSYTGLTDNNNDGIADEDQPPAAALPAGAKPF